MAELATSEQALRSAVGQAKRRGQRVGLVPTMGALHAGHLSLIEAARGQCPFVVVSIFVNPTQFGPHEDFDRYPRQLEDDCRQLESLADLVFAPTADVMYPPGFSTSVDPPRVATRWEGACRPGHFRGVATVVLKLFSLVSPHIAYFGEKDYQQLQVIRHMVTDLNLPVQIVGCPLIRDPDGIAMSSRNRQLDEDQRRRARSLSQALFAAQQAVDSGERNVAEVVQLMTAIMQAAPVEKIDYIAMVDPETLDPCERIDRPLQALVAAHVGTTRLIDNMRIHPPV